MALSWYYTATVNIGGDTNSTTINNSNATLDMDLADMNYYVDISDVLVPDSSGPSSGASNPSGPTGPSSSANNGINADGSANLCIPISASILYNSNDSFDSSTTNLTYSDIGISSTGFSFNSVTFNNNNFTVSIYNIYDERLYDESHYLTAYGTFYNNQIGTTQSICIDNSRIYFTNPPQLNLDCSSEFVDGDTTVEYGSNLTIKFKIEGISSAQLQNLCNISVTSSNDYVTIVSQTSSASGSNSIVSIKITGNNRSSANKTSTIRLSITTNSYYITLNNSSNLTDSVTITSYNTIIFNTLIDVSKNSITLNKIQNIDSRYALIDLLKNPDDIIIYCYTSSSLSQPYEDNCDTKESFGAIWLNCAVTSNNTNIVTIESIEDEDNGNYYNYYLIAKSPGTTTITLKTSKYTFNNVIYNATSKTVTVTVTEQSLNPVSSGKIATINDINTKFNTTIPTDEQNLNLCVSYSMIKDITVIAPLTTNTHYLNNQLVILDAIKYILIDPDIDPTVEP